MEGEYRDCQMRTKTVAWTTNLDTLNKLPRLFCAGDVNGLFDFQTTVAASIVPPPNIKIPPNAYVYFGVTEDKLDHEFHVMPVRYWGRIDRTDKSVIDWRCQRLSGSLACKALN